MEKESSDNKIATLSGEIFDDLEARMLRLAMSDGESHEDIESVLDGCGIGNKPFKTQIIAFNLFKSHPEIQISKETTLALMRAKVTCRERYLQILPHLLKILKTLDDREIRILLIKGGAMKAYRPDCPRWMADVDIVVPEDKYEEAVELSEKVGYKPLKRLHSTDLKDPVSGQTFVDIHHYISTNTNKGYMLNDGLWKRAINIPVSFFPHHVLVPCPEDMMFISLVNFWKNVNDMTSEGSVASLFFDLKLLKEYKDDFDWEIVRSDAMVTGTVETACFSVRLLESIMPGFFPDNFLGSDISLAKLDKLIERTVSSRTVLGLVRNFNLIGAIKNVKCFINYTYYRAKTFILKRIPHFLTKGNY